MWIESWQAYRARIGREHEKGSGHTLTWWCPSTAATAEKITVDGGGDLRQGHTGDDP